MSLAWKPKADRLQQLIQEEEARIRLLSEKRFTVEETPLWSPEREPLFPQSLSQPELRQWQEPLPAVGSTAVAVRPTVKPVPQKGIILPKTEPITKEEPVQVPFWQRAGQIFAAPFEWIDENIIQPGWALLGTTAGFVPEVERKPGEDFWDWKRRSWAGWETPGVDINVPWSDKPWRIDVKGVMEFAPWLLIPGAGQVGGGTRIAAGIAGVLGKAGRVGRVLGTAVEYSPWGLVEKTAGVAIKGGVRAVGKISERVSGKVSERLYGKYTPPPVPEEVAELSQYFKQAVMPSYREFRKLVPEEVTAKQAAKIRQQLDRARRGEISYTEAYEFAEKARGGVGIKEKFAMTPEALATRQAEEIAQVEARVVSGEITKSGGKGLITKIKKSPAFTAVPFTPDKVEKLLARIDSMAESEFVMVDSAQALRRFFAVGELPTNHNLRDWKVAFGDDFAKAVGKLGQEEASNLMDTLQIGKSLVSAWDVSGTFRQGLFFSLLHPTLVPKWFGRQMKAMLSEKLSLDMDDVLRTKEITNTFVRHGGYLRPVRGTSAALAEEAFPSQLARRIPGVRRSERAFATYLNQSSVDTFEKGYNAMVAQGATDEMINLWTQFINLAGGRGTLPKSLEKYAPALNAVLFSPRLQMATLQLPRQIGRMFLSGNPYMRKEAARALVTFAGGGASLLGLLNATGVSKVEIDPRSGDFGKIIIGDRKTGTRLDIWRGYVQYVRFAAQLLSGERKSAYGNMNKAERGEIAGRFVQSKMSPIAGLFSDLWRGETYMGKPIFNDTTGFIDVVKERVLPLAAQDVIDAMEQSGVNGIWVAAPATLGIGALTYVNDFVRVKEKIAREMGYESWDDIDPKTQREVENRNAELQAATIEFERQVMGTAWGDWKLAGNAIEDVFRQNVENAVAEYRQTGKGYQFNEKITDAFTARRGGYAVREQEGRFADIVKRMKTEDTLEALVNLGPEQLAIKIYNDALFGDDMYDEFGNYRFEEANIQKQRVRQMLGEEMFSYVEDYRGLKFETLADEFQDLMKARELMRPYWEVRNRVIKLFGERYAESSRGQALISKLRKQKRLGNSALEEAYQRFYVQ
mgnify:CR=1 FL=1